MATTASPGGALTEAHRSSLGEPPDLTGLSRLLSDGSREAFRLGNRYLMVPFHRAGGASWLGSPLAGWQCLLTTRGRRSGLPRPTPLGYVLMDGAAWVMAGYGPRTQWFRNIVEDPTVELRLPARAPMAAVAEVVGEPEVRARVIPALCRSMALPGLMIGCFPPTSSDERILECVSWVPLVRIRPTAGDPLVPGPDDPGGRGWIWRQALMVAGTLGVLALAGRILRPASPQG